MRELTTAERFQQAAFDNHLSQQIDLNGQPVGPIIRTQFRRRPYLGKYMDAKSSTIPDMGMTVQEILRRIDQGLPVAGGRVPLYHGDVIMPVEKSLSLVDRRERLMALREEIAAYEADLNDHVNKQREAEAEAAKKVRMQQLEDLKKEFEASTK